MSSLRETLSSSVPFGTTGTFVSATAVALAMTPAVGLVPNVWGSIASAYDLPTAAGNLVCGTITLGLAPFFIAKISGNKKPRRGRRYRGLNFGPVRATERDLCTGMLVLGATGSGKTSRILFPALEDLFNTYSHEDPDVNSTDPYQKLGAFILEVKGKFFETVVYLAHQSGRCASKDVRVIRANSTLPVVEFRDETGRRFFLNGQPCSTGSEVSCLYHGKRFADGSAIESPLFKRIRQEELRAREDELRSMPVAVSEDTRFIGWRRRGGKFHRVSHTERRDEPQFTGETIAPPKMLFYRRTIYLHNGLSYNLIDPKVPSSEAASRIAMVAKMTSGEGKDSNNAYFYQAAARAIDNAIRLFRIVNPKEQATVIDVNRIITQDSAQSAALNKIALLKNALAERRIKEERESDSYSAEETTKLINQYDDLVKWFVEEWAQLKKTNTGSSIVSTIGNLFGPFMRDPALQETYCRAATFSFEECLQKGTIFAFVPGDEYEMQARLLGTVLKMDWQSRMLRRVSEGADALNKNRVILGVADECQAFIISGSQDAGDPKFMSLCRESRIINIAATQSEAWVYAAISRNEARVWLQSFRTRVWLTQTDMETSQAASELCGKIKQEKRTSDENIDVGTLMAGNGSAKQKFEYIEKPRFEPHEFTSLSEDEAIVFNNGEGLKGAEIGTTSALKGKVPWRFITSPEGVAAIADRMRWWFVENWENELHAAKRSSFLDPHPSATGTQGSAPASVVEALPVGASAGLETNPVPSSASSPLSASTPLAQTPTADSLEQAKISSNPNVSTQVQMPPLDPSVVLPGRGLAAITPLPPEAVRTESSETASEPPKIDPTKPDAGQSNTVTSPASGAITPGQIMAQEAAFRTLVEANPFSLIEYSETAGVQRSVQAAVKGYSEVLRSEHRLVGEGGSVGGNEKLLRPNVDTTPGMTTVPEIPVSSPLEQIARRTVAANNGNARMPSAARRDAPATRAGWGA